jgi:hypothetical protein
MKKYFYLEHWLGPRLMYIDAYGSVEEDRIIAISSRGVSKFDKCEHKPCVFDNKDEYLKSLQLKCDCGIKIGYYNLGDANHLEVLKMVGHPKMNNTPLPTIKDNNNTKLTTIEIFPKKNILFTIDVLMVKPLYNSFLCIGIAIKIKVVAGIIQVAEIASLVLFFMR